MQQSSSQSYSKAEMAAKSISGFRWTTVISGSALLCGYLTNILLGRVSPETLGVYGLVVISTSIVLTFLVFGGGNVLTSYLPGLVVEYKAVFLRSYSLIVFVFAAVMLLLLAFFPVPITWLYRNMPPQQVLYYIVLLAPIMIVIALTTATLKAELHITAAVLIENGYRLGLFLLVLLVVVFFPSVLAGNYQIFVPGLVLASYMLAMLFGLSRLSKLLGGLRSLLVAKPGFWLPSGFWGFVVPFHIGTIFFFFNEHGDQLLVAALLDVSSIGLYRAALVTAAFVKIIPSMIASVSYQLMCNLFAHRAEATLRRVYMTNVIGSLMVSGLVGSIIIVLSMPLLVLFGGTYVSASQTTLKVMAIGWALAFPIDSLSAAALTTWRHTKAVAIIFGCAAGLYFLLGWVLIPILGLLGAALAVALNRLLLAVIMTLAMIRLTPLRLSRSVYGMILIEFTILIVVAQLEQVLDLWVALAAAITLHLLLAWLALRTRVISTDDVLMIFPRRIQHLADNILHRFLV